MVEAIDMPKTSFSTILKAIVTIVKTAYLIFAALFVCYGFYNTVARVQQGTINVKSGVQVVSKVKFPSITFCHKFRYGGKDALLAYSNLLFQKWKKSGKL